MNKLFNFTQAKGEWHKFLSFNLGGGAKLYKNFAQKLLAVSLCMAVVLMAVPLGWQSVHVAAAAGKPTRAVTSITVPEANLDTTGTDKTKWKKNGDVYETQNQGSNSTACTMEVPVEVTVGYVELEFDWKVSSEAGYDFLRFELKADGDVLQSNQKSGEETDFDTVVLKLDKGTYTLTFTYQGDGGSASGTCLDTGYVTNLNLVTYSGVSAISTTMYAEPKDLIDADNFSLATADTTKVGKISFGTRPGEVKYYKHDWKTPYSVGTADTPTPITWLIAGGEKFTPAGGEESDGLVLYSAAPLVGCDNLNSATATSVFQTDTSTRTYDAPANSGYGDTESTQSVYANHWGASNARTSLRNLVPALDASTNYFKKTEGALMAESSVKTYDMLNKSGENPIEYTTADVLYAPRLDSTTYLHKTNTSVTVGGADSLSIDCAHWGASSWLRSPNPSRSGSALVALPGGYVSIGSVNYGDPSISAAFRLNLSSVLFTSAASAAPSAEGGKFEAISADTPMTLRLDGTDSGKPLEGISTPTVEAGAITYTAPTTGARLMVLATGSDGATYQYFKDVTDSDTLALSDITSSLPAGMTFTARAWLETDDTDGSTVTYATKATDAFTFNTHANKKFFTKDELLDLCELYENGLLATGSGTDVKLRINFGQRPEAANYYKDLIGTDDTAAAGPTSWLVAGSEKFTPAGQSEETDGLVLYSEEPLVSAYRLRDSSSKMNSKFQPTYFTDPSDYTYWVGSSSAKSTFNDDWGDYSSYPLHVYADHWGASNLRQVLTAIYNGTKLTVGGEEADYAGFFNATEKGLMSESTINTYDMQDAEFDDDGIYVSGAQEFTTTDYLYAPRCDSSQVLTNWKTTDKITVGGADSLTIASAHWGGSSWLRSPIPTYGLSALVAVPGSYFAGLDVGNVAPSVSAAFRLNLSSVIFTSAASAASSAEGGEKFSKISADTPMTLRVHKYLPDFTGTATLSTDNRSITVNNAAEGDVLMVQGVTAEGENWSYSKKMGSTGSATVTAGDVVAACTTITGFALDDFSTCNIWLERTTGEEGCTVTYASTPIVAGAGEASPSECTIEPVSKLDATCTEPGHQAHYKCSVCGQLFSDADGNSPIDEPPAIDELGHNWDGGTVTTQPTTSAPGVKTYKCSVCGHTRTETIPKLDGDDLQDFRPDGTTEPATWGSAVTRGDIPHWVAADGTTSVQVPADNGIIWLKEDSDGTSAWYGLDNSAGVFAEGSRFWVRWLNKKSDPTLWQYYYDKFDTEHKTDVESDNLWIFLIGVTAPDGTEYTDFDTEVPLYIQKGPDWDGNDIRSVFISGAYDEVLLSHFHGTMDYPESALHPAAEFYKIMLSHFSPYAIFDELTDEEKAALGPPSTGDISTELLISGLAIVLVSSLGVMLRLITNKKKFEE